nr:MAG TPA: hypothetical protein [Caudoviricetes sp.]
MAERRSVPFNKKRARLLEKDTPGIRTRKMITRQIPPETLCADFNRRGDHRLRNDWRLKWLNFM